MSSIEREEHSLTVETLLNVIHGLEVAGKTKLGTSPEHKLVAFFLGPDTVEEQRHVRRQLRALADRLGG